MFDPSLEGTIKLLQKIADRLEGITAAKERENEYLDNKATEIAELANNARDDAARANRIRSKLIDLLT